MRRLGETASDVAGGWYSPKSTIPRAAEVERREQGGGERLLTPSGEIECGANFTRDTATDSPSLSSFHSFSRFTLPPFVSYGQTNALFFLSFPLIAESEAPAMVIPFLLCVCVCVCSFPSFALLSFASLYFYLPLPPFSSRCVSFVFFFFYWHRFHKYSMASNVPRDCKTSGRFRLCQGLCAFELDIAKVDVSLARSPGYS